MNELVKNKIVRVLREEFGNDLSEYTIEEIEDYIGDTLNNYEISVCELENLILYKENYYDKKDILDNSDGVHIEEVEEVE